MGTRVRCDYRETRASDALVKIPVRICAIDEQASASSPPMAPIKGVSADDRRDR